MANAIKRHGVLTLPLAGRRLVGLDALLEAADFVRAT